MKSTTCEKKKKTPISRKKLNFEKDPTKIKLTPGKQNDSNTLYQGNMLKELIRQQEEQYAEEIHIVKELSLMEQQDEGVHLTQKENHLLSDEEAVENFALINSGNYLPTHIINGVHACMRITFPDIGGLRNTQFGRTLTFLPIIRTPWVQVCVYHFKI